MAVGTGHAAQLGGVHTLDHRTGLLGQSGIVCGDLLGHGIRHKDGIHTAAAFQQFGNGIFTVDQIGAGQRFLLGCGALLPQGLTGCGIQRTGRTGTGCILPAGTVACGVFFTFGIVCHNDLISKIERQRLPVPETENRLFVFLLIFISV